MDIFLLMNFLEKGKVPAKTLLTGKEEFFLAEYIDRLRQKVNFPELNINEFTGQFTYDEMRKAIMTYPAMSEFRVVLLKKTGYFTWNKDEELMKLLEAVPRHIRLVAFEQDYATNLKSYKRFAQGTMIIKCDDVAPGDVKNWIMSELDAKKASIEPAALSGLVDKARSEGMYAVSNAVSYLAALGRKINEADLINYFGEDVDTNFYTIYNAMTTSELPAEIEKKIGEGLDPYQLMATIMSAFRQAMDLAGGNFSGTPFMRRVVGGIKQSFPADVLYEINRELARTDVEMKSTFADPRALLLNAAFGITSRLGAAR